MHRYEKKPVLHQQELSAITCDCPDCMNSASTGHPMTLKARCHFQAGMTVTYHKGVLILTCAECGGWVANVAVESKMIPHDLYERLVVFN